MSVRAELATRAVADDDELRVGHIVQNGQILNLLLGRESTDVADDLSPFGATDRRQASDRWLGSKREESTPRAHRSTSATPSPDN
ncbi:hypothetical protein [Brevibacterium sp. UCMA 11752]|uniref:hypothetical protein n=1 Tax=Brevibacterium sp. UCMA 11752 TaxID=2745946 RepID=UPI003FA4CC43